MIVAASPPLVAEWQQRWATTADTQASAAETVALCAAFLDHLRNAGRSRQTIAAHTRNLWLIGNEIMAFMAASAANRTRGLDWFIAARIAGDDPPMPKQLKQKTERDAYMATVRALLRFVRGKRLNGGKSRQP